MTPAENEDAELVESGSIRIDRPRALKKIRQYQLPDPTRGVFFWVRTAVASNATKFEVRHSPRFLELRFNGNPLKHPDLKDPYSGLFDNPDPIKRNLALGLLWLVRENANNIEIHSGGKRLRITSLEKDTLDQSNEPKDLTIIKAKWNGLLQIFKEAPWKRPAAEYRLRCAMSGLNFTVAGKDIIEDPFHDRKVTREFKWKDATIKMSYWSSGGTRSNIDLSSLGVRADAVTYKPHFMPCTAYADSPLLTLDASEFKVVKNGELDALIQRIGKEEKKLVELMLDSLEKGEADEAMRSALLEASWLLLKSPKTDSKNPFLKRLWDMSVIPGVSAWGGNLREIMVQPISDSWQLPVRHLNKLRALKKRVGQT